MTATRRSFMAGAASLPALTTIDAAPAAATPLSAEQRFKHGLGEAYLALADLQTTASTRGAAEWVLIGVAKLVLGKLGKQEEGSV